MNEIVLRAGPGTALQFPACCVHCAGIAVTTMRIQKPVGRVARMVDVPLCAACAQELTRLSAAEEQQQKLRRLLLLVSLPILFALALFFTPAAYPFMLRMLIALLVTLGWGGVVWFFFRWRLQEAALPQKKAIRAAAQISDFSWGRTSFTFANGDFFSRFKALNSEWIVDET